MYKRVRLLFQIKINWEEGHEIIKTRKTERQYNNQLKYPFFVLFAVIQRIMIFKCMYMRIFLLLFPLY